jgi:hypothetical protein
MKTVSKEHKYRGEKFLISVELYTKAERRLDGMSWHTVRITSLDKMKYFITEEIEDKRLKMYLKMDVPIMISDYVDEALDGKTGLEAELEELGYE